MVVHVLNILHLFFCIRNEGLQCSLGRVFLTCTYRCVMARQNGMLQWDSWHVLLWSSTLCSVPSQRVQWGSVPRWKHRSISTRKYCACEQSRNCYQIHSCINEANQLWFGIYFMVSTKRKATSLCYQSLNCTSNSCLISVQNRFIISVHYCTWHLTRLIP